MKLPQWLHNFKFQTFNHYLFKPEEQKEARLLPAEADFHLELSGCFSSDKAAIEDKPSGVLDCPEFF